MRRLWSFLAFFVDSCYNPDAHRPAKGRLAAIPNDSEVLRMGIGRLFRHQRDEGGALYGPLPPLSELDFDSLVKYVHSAERHCQETGRGIYAFLDWAIQVLSSSLAADCTSRIFLPKTDTMSFVLDDLFPFSSLSPTGRSSVSLGDAIVIAPLWSNAETCYALDIIRSEGFNEELSQEAITGYYIRELNMAFIRSGSHLAYFGQFWRQGAVILDTFSIVELEPVLQTDGRDWLLCDETGEPFDTIPVEEPRMAALYQLALWRFIRRDGKG